MSRMRLKDKVAIVTGASQGIGQGVAVRLAKEGAHVVINYRSAQDSPEPTEQLIKEFGNLIH